MTRRYWPILLAAATILVLGWYLAFTRYVFREITEQAAVNSRIYSWVQRGLLSPDDALGALFEIQGLLNSLDLPLVAFNADGEPYGASLPGFDADLSDPDDRRRVLAAAAEIERRLPNNVVSVPGAGRVVFGEPPLVRWLRWMPWLQVTVAGVLLLVAVIIVRADMRAERERLWAAMARELAHQMGTPLSSLAGWIEVLGMPDQERESVVSSAHIAEVIATDVERLERVSRRFELIGKPSALERVELREVIAELERYFRPRLPKLGRGVRLQVRCRGKLAAVHANRVLLVWALENVVKNAVDALAGRGGRILIIADTDPDRANVHVHIADNGPGIAAHMRDRIFEPGVSTKSSGWGVGLSLTRRIIEQLHGGRVTVRNRKSGGAVFDVVLPVAGSPRRRWLRSR